MPDFADALDALDASITTALPPVMVDVPLLDGDAIGEALPRISDHASSLIVARSVAETRLAKVAPFGQEVVEMGGHVFKINWSKKRTTWDNPALVSKVRSEVVKRACARPDGEMFDGADTDTAERAFAAVAELVNLAGYNMRAWALRAWGIEPDDYCEAERAVPSVQIIH